ARGAPGRGATVKRRPGQRARSTVVTLVTVVGLFGVASAAAAQVRPEEGVDTARDPCIASPTRCGASVSLGPGPFAGVANQSRACGGPACRTARVVYGRYSDFMPIAGSGRPRVIVTRAAPPSAAGGAGGASGGGG